ncbi:hypothetical protein FPV67DRAFT_1410960, partial [Lyophyllum atratum]
MPSNRCAQRLGKLPLVIGMPVLICHNFDVPGGVVNGSRGRITGIRYNTDNRNRRHLLSVIVYIEDSTDSNLPQLEPHYMPILPDSNSI